MVNGARDIMRNSGAGTRSATAELVIQTGQPRDVGHTEQVEREHVARPVMAALNPAQTDQAKQRGKGGLQETAKPDRAQVDPNKPHERAVEGCTGQNMATRKARPVESCGYDGKERTWTPIIRL